MLLTLRVPVEPFNLAQVLCRGFLSRRSVILYLWTWSRSDSGISVGYGGRRRSGDHRSRSRSIASRHLERALQDIVPSQGRPPLARGRVDPARRTVCSWRRLSRLLDILLDTLLCRHSLSPSASDRRSVRSLDRRSQRLICLIDGRLSGSGIVGSAKSAQDTLKVSRRSTRSSPRSTSFSGDCDVSFVSSSTAAKSLPEGDSGPSILDRPSLLPTPPKPPPRTPGALPSPGEDTTPPPMTPGLMPPAARAPPSPLPNPPNARPLG